MKRKTATRNTVHVKQIVMFEFNCSENLIFFSQRFYKTQKIIKNELYVYKNRYRILFYCEKKYVKELLKFSGLADNISLLYTDIANTYEHAKKISENNAVEKLGKAFIKTI